MANINGAKLGVYLRKTPKWIPKKWKAKYTQIVFMAAQGYSNEAIGNAYRMGPQQVSNILNLPEAIRMKNELCDNLESSLKEDINKTLEMTGRKAVERIKAVIYDDQLFEHNPLAIFDRSRMLLQSTGVLKSESHSSGQNNNNTTNVIIGSDVARILGEAMVKSQRIQAANAISLPAPKEIVP